MCTCVVNTISECVINVSTIERRHCCMHFLELKLKKKCGIRWTNVKKIDIKNVEKKNIKIKIWWICKSNGYVMQVLQLLSARLELLNFCGDSKGGFRSNIHFKLFYLA